MVLASDRYDRAREHLQVVQDLWGTVEPDAIVMNRDGTVFADPTKIHLLNHDGKYYKVRGPLPTMPSPQGRPVMVQAGQSDDGMDLASRFADIQFVHRRTDASIKAHRRSWTSCSRSMDASHAISAAYGRFAYRPARRMRRLARRNGICSHSCPPTPG
jgi:alkanesulfonate monooxygenase SsuD/methylene tetrahydromethanopterin reductase-like flavin-dependent oxidoreductase (luciferase family)